MNFVHDSTSTIVPNKILNVYYLEKVYLNEISIDNMDNLYSILKIIQ